MISVAMTTYNGAKYVIEQLQSILDQTTKPDEVIIIDDNSTDHTVSLIKGFINDNNIRGWKVYINEANIGWMRNFWRAITKTSGDIIFFADQDDVWYSSKIEEMTNVMKNYQAGCIIANYDLIDEQGRRIKKGKNRTSVKKIQLDKKFYSVKELGCAMCIDKTVKDKLVEISLRESEYDFQCIRIAMLFSTLYKYDSVQLKHRIHSESASHVGNGYGIGSSTLNRRIQETRICINWIEKILVLYDFAGNENRILNEVLDFQKRRYRYFVEDDKSFFFLFPILGKYSYFREFLGDVVYKSKAKRRKKYSVDMKKQIR